MANRTLILLVGSLALNAALVGLVGGRMVNNQRAPIEEKYVERYTPASETVLQAWAQLPDAKRESLRQELRDAWNAAEAERELLSEAGRAVAEAARTEPFDEARLRNTLFVFQRRELQLQQRAEDILISHMSDMPPEARRIAAQGLLTPFSARVQRRNAPEGEKRAEYTTTPSDAGGAPPGPPRGRETALSGTPGQTP